MNISFLSKTISECQYDFHFFKSLLGDFSNYIFSIQESVYVKGGLKLCADIPLHGDGCPKLPDCSGINYRSPRED